MKTNAKRLLATLMLLVLLLAGCQRARPAPEEPKEGEVAEQVIYTSFFPLYALAQGILKDVSGMNLRCLVQPQVGCLRSYALSEWDLTRLADANAVLIGGRGLESFEGLLSQLGDTGPAVCSVMNGLTLIGQDGPVDDENESHLIGPNPWLFLSVEGAKQISEVTAAAMIALDPGFEDLYASNLDAQTERLEALQQNMQALLIEQTPVSVGLMHEGFAYIAQDLGLDAPVRIDREPGTALYDRDLEDAIRQLKEGGARVVLIERQAPQSLRDALAEAFEVAPIDTLSTFPAGAGEDYFEQVMLENARAIADAFRRVGES